MSSMAILQCALSGIKRVQATIGSNKPRPRLPITSALMKALKKSWESQAPSYNTAMLWAATCTCYFGFLRSGEATVPSESAYDPAVHLSITDVSLDSQTNAQVIAIRIKASKTDSFRKGVTVYLGRTSPEVCPVAAILSYIGVRGTSPGPLFKFSDGSPLTRDSFVRQLRAALSPSGVDPAQYSGHSFRIGTATSTAAAGVPDVLIQTLGRWRSTAYLNYIKIPPASLASVSSRLT